VNPVSSLRSLRAITLAVLATLSLSLAAAPVARADADPPSDYLFAGDLYYPYGLVSGTVVGRLEALLKRVHRAGYPLKLALIASRDDLGGVPRFFGHPQEYATFLAREIAYNRVQPLLVIMPSGFGLVGAGSDAQAGLQGLQPPGNDTRQLGSLGLAAVAGVARAAGYPVPVPKGAARVAPRGSSAPIVAFLGPLALVMFTGFLAAVRNRRRPARDENPHA
jgi:hypothetical protein